MRPPSLEQLRNSIDQVDHELLELIAKRRELSRMVARTKLGAGLPFHDPARETTLLVDRARRGMARDLAPELVVKLWQDILDDSVRLQGDVALTRGGRSFVDPPLVADAVGETVIEVGAVKIGGPQPVLIAGPCAVESPEQVMDCARAVRDAGGHLLRGGCFKPRTSPYSFQGLGFEGLAMLAEAGHVFGLPIVTEVPSPEHVGPMGEVADILQVGARNMQNFTLLTELGRSHRPVLLKRGMSATIEELLNAAEYILSEGNGQVILCERGIRTFETATRNTLDVSAVPVLRERTHLPVVVDPSHAAGKRSLVLPLARAALAAGAHGVMVEVHPEPENALSDGPQALLFEDLRALVS